MVPWGPMQIVAIPFLGSTALSSPEPKLLEDSP
jgi:hypothetical protein